MCYSTFFRICLLLFSIQAFCQQEIKISGVINSERGVIPDVVIELKINEKSFFSISDSKGLYKFPNHNYVDKDSVFLKVDYIGYKLYRKKIIPQKDFIFNIKLDEQDARLLNEVEVISSNNIITARKSSYKINQKDFIKNALAPEALVTIPNLYYDKINGSAIVDGKLNAVFFIDGIEALDKEVENISVSDIERVEIMNNPSSRYGTDFLGAVINIITVKKTEEFIKGNLAFTSGLLNEYWSANPSFSYKRGKFTLKSNFNYSENHIVTDYNSYRNDVNGEFYIRSKDNSVGKQPYIQNRFKILLSKKSNLTFTSLINGYKFIGIAKGSIKHYDGSNVDFVKDGLESNQNWNLASVYSYNFKESKAVFIKTFYKVNDNKNKNNFVYNDNSENNFYIRSKSKEFSLNLSYEVEETKIFKKNSEFYSDIKYINRQFNFSEINYNLSQNILDATIELDTKWSHKFSTEAVVTYENVSNSNNLYKQNLNFILPVFNALYRFDNKIDAKFSYSKKILRPSASDLNTQLILINPGNAVQGNFNLNPQMMNYFALNFNKSVNKNNFSLKVYNESINNAIVNVYRADGDLLIKTLDNAAHYNSTGVNVGLRTKFFKKINTNINTGISYNIFEDNSEDALISKNTGYTLNSSINLSTNLFKDKYSVSISGRYNGPNYSLLNKRTNFPYIDLSISTNYFNDKLSLSLYGRGLLGNKFNGYRDTSSSANFYQRIEVDNDFSNVLLTLSYRFGKTFNDKIENNDINNNDIR